MFSVVEITGLCLLGELLTLGDGALNVKVDLELVLPLVEGFSVLFDDVL